MRSNLAHVYCTDTRTSFLNNYIPSDFKLSLGSCRPLEVHKLHAKRNCFCYNSAKALKEVKKITASE